jgi:hypothetical protein
MCTFCANIGILECIDSLLYEDKRIPGADRDQGISCANTSGSSFQSALTLLYMRKRISLELGICVSCANTSGSSFQSALTLLCIRN